MQLCYQSSWATTVMRADNVLEIYSILNGMRYEANVYLKVDILSLTIEDARWEVFRSPECDLPRSSQLTVLIGTPAKNYSRRLILGLLDADINDVLAELIAEAIRCVIQAEPFIIKARGYKSYQEYDNDMQKLYINTCSCYSNIEPVRRIIWTDYMEDRCVRPHNVFNRSKTYHFSTRSDQREIATASFTDSFHELLLTATLNENGNIEDISGAFARCPEDTCVQGASLLKNLKGASLNQLNNKKVNGLIGGPCGCIHFVELCSGLVMAWFEKTKIK